MSSTSIARSERVALSRLWWAGLVAAVGAAVANILLFTIEKTLLGVPFVMPLQGPGSVPEPLPVGMVAIASAAPAIAATVLLAVLGRLVRRPVLVFQIIAVVFLLASLGGPLSLPVDGATRLALIPMHVVAAAVIVGVLTTLGREQ